MLGKRVVSAGRAEMQKMSTVESLRGILEHHEVTKAVEGRENLVIDNTEVGPEEAARRIVEHYGLPVVST
jgi:hypothetical protein